MQYLNQSDYNAFTHHYAGQQPVVMQHTRVSSLIAHRLKGLDAACTHVLAMPQVTGQPGKEQIIWGTDQFSSPARPLAQLVGDERERYESILADTMTRLGHAVDSADDETREVLAEAVTYHSPDTVYCGDGKVVITEWGMHPRNVSDYNRMPLGVDVEPEKVMGRPAEAVKHDDPESTAEPALSPESATHKDTRDSAAVPPVTPPAEPPVTPPAPPVPPLIPPAAPQGANRKRRNWLKWILIALAAVLLIWLLCKLLNSCSEEGGEPFDHEIVALPPDIDPARDVVESPDSMTRVVANRLILVITEGGSVNEFVREFRSRYPDKNRYQFANPDTLIPRLVLILPADERQDMIDRLPSEFPSWELLVLPETLFGTSAVPSDPAFSDPRKRWYFDMTEVYDAWDVTRGDKNIRIAVIDDGFDLDHPEIKGKVADVYNAVYHNRDIFPQPGGHGMHVAATAAGAADNGEGSSGIAPGCDLVLIQVGDRNGLMPTSAVIDGALYAIKSGAKVVNMSLGMEFSNMLQFAPPALQEEIVRNQFLEEEHVWTKIFEMAEREGVTFVLAGGNQNLIIGLDPMQRSGYTINVSAVTPDKSKASFSNYGRRSTISAPGVDIYNAVPGGKYEYLEGTSMASPIVAGGVALLKSMQPSLSTPQVADIMRSTGIPVTDDIGPILNFGRAAELVKEKGPDAAPSQPGADVVSGPVTSPGEKDSPSADCETILRRYIELLDEIERLRRDYPGCIESVDTLEIPEGATVADLRGTWKSTTPLVNNDREDVVLYFTFDGSPRGVLELMEPDGKRYTGALDVAVHDDKVDMHQPEGCSGPGGAYYPYDFTLVPDRNRVAVGVAMSQKEKYRKIRFNLVRIH